MSIRNSKFKLLNSLGYLRNCAHIETIPQIISTLEYPKSIYLRLTLFRTQ